MNVHLIDGTFELYRAFYGAPPRRNAAGQEVGAVAGLLRSLLALLADPQVTHVAIAFDTVIESFRNELFAGYKTGEGMAPELWAQFPLAEQATRALGLVTWSMTAFEADDALATGAERYAQAPGVKQVLLCSPDKDLAQCVRPGKVLCLDRMRNRLLDVSDVTAKFGVPPSSIPDWLALVGDSADGIPGIPRWGAKSAAAVLAAYPHIEQIPASATDWKIKVRGAETLAANLVAGYADALLYRQLATLRTDVPIQETLSALNWRGPDQPAFQAICQQLNDPQLSNRAAALARTSR